MYAVLLNHLDHSHPFSTDCQWGFTAGKSTTGALVNTIEGWNHVLESGSDICAVFFDLQKAFDSVPHAQTTATKAGKLTRCMIPICIPGSHTTCVKEPNAWVLVVLHRISVQLFQVSPRDLYSSHYTIYISRVSISSGSLTVHADDLVLYRPVCSSSDFRLLQQDIDNINSWTSVNHLTLNSTKCKYMVISRKRHPPTPTDPLLVNHSQLERLLL